MCVEPLQLLLIRAHSAKPSLKLRGGAAAAAAPAASKAGGTMKAGATGADQKMKMPEYMPWHQVIYVTYTLHDM